MIEKIDAALPQTQCGECSYAGCRPYAEAIVTRQERIDRCPPGGVDTLKALAQLTDQDPTRFIARVETQTRPAQLAVIEEDKCIGCTKCIQACPVDAIIGSGKQMHTIIESECTGCELCVPVCPTDCIKLTPVDAYQFDKGKAKARFEAKQQRTEQKNKKAQLDYSSLTSHNKASKQDYIQAALARVQQKQHASK